MAGVRHIGDGYWVTVDGRILSDRVRRALGYKKGSRSVIDPSKRHELRATANVKSGYLVVYLKINGKVRARYVHRLVLEAFSGPCPMGHEARHLDGDKENNSIENLRWGTHAENQADKVSHGTNARGESHKNSKLTAATVIEMRAARRRGVTIAALAAKYHVASATVGEVCRGNAWAHIEMEATCD